MGAKGRYQASELSCTGSEVRRPKCARRDALRPHHFAQERVWFSSTQRYRSCRTDDGRIMARVHQLVPPFPARGRRLNCLTFEVNK
jgi:hypothetical protein